MAYVLVKRVGHGVHRNKIVEYEIHTYKIRNMSLAENWLPRRPAQNNGLSKLIANNWIWWYIVCACCNIFIFCVCGIWFLQLQSIRVFCVVENMTTRGDDSFVCRCLYNQIHIYIYINTLYWLIVIHVIIFVGAIWWWKFIKFPRSNHDLLIWRMCKASGKRKIKNNYYSPSRFTKMK